MIAPPAEPPQWGQCVLTVERHIVKQDRRALKFAARKLNAATGLRFRWVKRGGQVTVSYGKLDAPYWGWTNLYGVGAEWRKAQVVLDRGKTKGLSRKVRRSLLMHELGHVVGLPHSDRERSVMFPWVTGKTVWSNQDERRLSKVGC